MEPVSAVDIPEDATLDDVLSPRDLHIADEAEAIEELSKEIVVYLLQDNIPAELHAPLQELALQAARPGSIMMASDASAIQTGSQGSWVVSFQHDGTLPSGMLSIQVEDKDPEALLPEHGCLAILVRYVRKCEAFRGLGHVLAATRYALTLAAAPSGRVDASDDDESMASASTSTPTNKERLRGRIISFLTRQEQCLFETLGTLLDCSRNGVLTVDSVKFFLRQKALIGCNLLHLYTEDTFQIPTEPFFGYFRGPYTQEELKEIDDYAYDLGIELVPLIQTLGHLAQMLQWPRYQHLQDTPDVLLAESEQVYAFIEKMIATVSAPLRTKKIHIGMDEAFGLGEGRFQQANPQSRWKDGTRIFLDHLKRVNEICKEKGLKPLIWSDMIFCLASKNVSLTGYYESDTPNLDERIPENIELVFWSYYHTTPQPYADKIRQHWELCNKAPWMASGLWTWGRFWCSLPFTFETVRASMKASKAKDAGVKHCITTVWGDEGCEMDIQSCLPGLQYFAEHAYTSADEVDVPLLKLKFDGITGGSFDAFTNASKLDDMHPEFQPAQTKAVLAGNMSKWLLWEEPFYGFLSPQYSNNYDLETHYAELADYLAMATDSDTDKSSRPIGTALYPFNERLRLPYLLATVLSLKCHLRDWLYQAYNKNDENQLIVLAGPEPESRLGRLRTAVDNLWKYHRAMWMEVNKPFGWEVLEIRYGGLRARLETMQYRIAAYLDRNDPSVTSLPELEVETHAIWSNSGPSLMLDWARAAKATAY